MKEPPKVSNRKTNKNPPRAIRREFYTPSDFEEALNDAMTTGQAIELPIANIHRSPYQTRGIRSTHLAEIKANIAANGLISPILVRQLNPGIFETIAGHHRILAFQDLGNEKIPCIVIKMDDASASAAVFYDNLLGPDLTDYEKFLGLQERIKVTGFSQVELAKEAGIAQQQVSKLLAYSGLPPKCHSYLKEYPEKLGANAAEALRELSLAGKSSLVIKAVEKIITDELNQKSAINWITAQGKVLKQQIKSKPIQVYTAGKKMFCQIQQADKVLRISCASQLDASELQVIIESAVREHIKNKRLP